MLLAYLHKCLSEPKYFSKDFWVIFSCTTFCLALISLGHSCLFILAYLFILTCIHLIARNIIFALYLIICFIYVCLLLHSCITYIIFDSCILLWSTCIYTLIILWLFRHYITCIYYYICCKLSGFFVVFFWTLFS